MDPESDNLDATRRDAAVTRREASMTRRERQPAPARTDPVLVLVLLPSALADRFRVEEELAQQGAEADVLRVRDRDGTDYVVKLYRRGFAVDPLVSHKLGELASRRLVRIHEAGTSDGRAYEVLEYVPGGSLEALLAEGRDATRAEIDEVVEQVAAGLAQLHAAGIVHRDLKPANILVRRRSPLDLVLTDFGLSRAIDASVAYLTTSRTTSYAAPEAFSGHTSPARDWWSLGIIVHELATGARVFSGLDERVVMNHITTRPIDLEMIADPRLRLLCRGLLTRDPDRRWGHAQVTAWLAGGSPPVAEERLASVGRDGRKPLWFNREAYSDKRALARALAADWRTAARHFLAFMGTPDNPGEGWRALRDWLMQFDDPARDDVEGRSGLIDTFLTGGLTPDHKLLHLLHWLDPGMPPQYLGVRLLPEDVTALARLATRQDGGEDTRLAREIVAHLLDGSRGDDLVRLLSRFEGGQYLPDLIYRWREHRQRWAGLPASIGELPEDVRRELAVLPVDAQLLALAAAPEEEAASLADLAQRTAGGVGRPPAWYQALRRQTAGDPVGQLTVVATAGFANAEARRLEQARRAWDAQEARRLAGSTAATLWAGAGGALLTVPLLLAVSTGLAPVRGGHALLVAVQVGAEVALARSLAGDYHSRYSLAGAAARRVGPLWRTLGAGIGSAARPLLTRPLLGCGAVGCLFFFVLPLVLSALLRGIGGWTTVFLVLTAAHGGWAWQRYQRWRTERARHRRVIEGAL